MAKEIENQISQLYRNTFGQNPESLVEIPACGSYRRYYRLTGGGRSAMATWNADKKENAAFVSFARSFHQAGLNVPEIYAVDETADIYLQEDLGNESLFSELNRLWLPLLDSGNLSHPNSKMSETKSSATDIGWQKSEPAFPSALKHLFQQSLDGLLRMQLFGKDGIDYQKCTPCPAFHRDAIHWDLNYFKYFFLKLMCVPFDEQALEDDFRVFSAFLLKQSCDYFLYRDFQSANIMLKDGEPYFIDFQGGRRGALQYDVASLLYDAKARLPKSVRAELAEYYFDALSQQIKMSRNDFMAYYQGYTLCRLMQALGAFGLRGVVEHKAGFKESIPPAIVMINDILNEWSIPVPVPELKACLGRLSAIHIE